MNLIFRHDKDIPMEDLLNLYLDAGWSAYTRDPLLLKRALAQSLEVITAWEDERLVGLVRCIGDGLIILYIQDILVLKEYQDQGVATRLLEKVLLKYRDVRQKVLLTEDAPDVRHFYEKNGFSSCDQGTLVAFARFS